MNLAYHLEVGLLQTHIYIYSCQKSLFTLYIVHGKYTLHEIINSTSKHIERRFVDRR